MGIFNGGDAKANGNSTATIIAKDCTITGEVEIDGGLHVDGRVSGNIRCTGTVIIGKSGRIDGEVVSGKILINGAFEGECRAEHIQILADGELKGTLYTEHLVIEPGGHFYGDSHSLSEKQKPLELVRPEVNQKDHG